MKAVIVAIAVSLAAGFTLGGVFGETEQPTSQPNPAENAAYIDAGAPIEQRLAALERVIAEERNARVVLEDQLTMLFDELDRIDGETSRGGPQETTVASAAEIAAAEVQTTQTPSSQRERSVDQLVEGGFSEARADRIVELSAEYQYEAMQARYEARQNGEQIDWFSEDLDPMARLRSELGDAEYEQYLEASGQPSVVAVQSVMPTSPASRIGLQPGDEIRAYNGRRIYNMRELQIATNSAQSGSEVVVEITRDGAPISMSMPAGPMGVTAGAWGRSPGGRRGN